MRYRPQRPKVVLKQHRDSLEGPDGSAKDAKYGFSRLIGPARAEPVMIAKHGRPVVVVMAVEEFERLNRIEHKAKGAQFE